MVLRHVLTESENGHLLMAIDWHIISENIPSLHTFTWHPHAISLGYLQDTSGLNKEFILQQGYVVVRRPTGGKAVIHDGDISIALYLPAELLPRRAKEAYAEMSDILREALFQLTELPLSRTTEDNYQNHEGCFSSSTGYEIGINGRKIAGIAVRKTRKGMLMHASIRMFPFIENAGMVFSPPEIMKGTSFKEHGKVFTPTQLHQIILEIISNIYKLTPQKWEIDKNEILSIYRDKVKVDI
ncbi:hypothetical protein GM182_03095 [bacterium 3DAC]|jgi:lipoate-protein ligase A|nr:hypothetical protein GM182_03095 [bacterium 3DAC]